jgi:large subunit ribosomal protein L18
MKNVKKISRRVSAKASLKLKRKQRVRKKITGTPERPRLSVFRSAKHVYCQIVDDLTGKTIVGASSFENKNKLGRANKDVCFKVGESLAARCKDKKITKVVMDRNGQIFHGRIKAIAEGARNGGLSF